MKRCATVFLLTLAGPLLAAGAAPASTLERTLRPVGGGAGLTLTETGGEPHLVRRAPAAAAVAGRPARRRSLAYFAHLTDLHIADEASPARHEHLFSLSRAFGGFWRPQEAFGPHVVDQVVRAVNRQRDEPGGERRRPGAARLRARHRRSRGQRAGKRGALGSARARRRPGRPLLRSPDLAREPVRGAPRAAIRRLNRAVALRGYAGVQDRGRFPDPIRSWPGALDRAQQPFTAEGLRVPWYSARGNHDALPQGHYGPAAVRPRSAPTGCRKVVSPAAGRVPAALRHDPWALLRARLPGARLVPPDPRPTLPALGRRVSPAARPRRQRARLRPHRSWPAPALARRRALLRLVAATRGCASSRSTPRPTPADPAATWITRSTSGWRASCAGHSAATSSSSSTATTRSR